MSFSSVSHISRTFRGGQSLRRVTEKLKRRRHGHTSVDMPDGGTIRSDELHKLQTSLNKIRDRHILEGCSQKARKALQDPDEWDEIWAWMSERSQGRTIDVGRQDHLFTVLLLHSGRKLGMTATDAFHRILKNKSFKGVLLSQ